METQEKNVQWCYMLLMAGFALSLLPVQILATSGVIIALAGIVWVYVLPMKNKENDYILSHTRWMKRTFWISSLLFILAVILSGATVSANANHEALLGINNGMNDGSVTPADMAAMMQQFQIDNAKLIVTTTIICFGVPLFYSVARFYKGLRLSFQTKAIDNVTTWWL